MPRLTAVVLTCLAAARPAPLLAGGPVIFLDETFPYDAQQPALGHWLGQVDAGPGPATWASVIIEPGTDSPSVRITMMPVMAIQAPCGDVAIAGRSVAFTLAHASARFEGQVSDDGQRLLGSVAVGAMPGHDGTFELARTPLVTDLADPMPFAGEIESPMGKLAMTMVFAETPGGNWVGQLDVPAQGLLGCPFSAVTRTGDVLVAQLDVPGAPLRVEAELADGGRRLIGTFNQGPFSLELDFARADGYEAPKFERPQMPEPPYPYDAFDVTIAHPEGHTLAGTVTKPHGAGPFPGVILVSGSGPQDRDETIFGHKPFLVIADHLTRNGIAVLRYDDRGTAGSTGDHSTATSRDLATDAEAALAFLRTVDGVDALRTGIVGHSEGALIAPMLATSEEPPNFMVLLAAPGVPGDELLRVQLELVLRAGGANEQMIKAQRAQQEEAFRLIRQGLTEENLEAIRAMARASLEATGLDGEALEQGVEAQVQALQSPWMRYFVSYDPRPRLRKVSSPVLALNGTLDLQVWHEQNLPEIEKAVRAGGGDVTIRAYEGLNHLFQPAETGAIGEYGTIEITFDESVLRDMVKWIHQNAGS